MDSFILTQFVFLIIILSSATCYDIAEEIKELKRQFDEHGDSLLVPYCHKTLGCFPIDGNFAERLVNFNPNTRETVDTTFRLYTRRNPTRAQALIADEPDTIISSSFDSSKRTMLIVHGYLEDTFHLWFSKINAEFLQNGDYNVINVDWGNLGASKTLYTQATANTRVVAAEMVYLLKTLKEKTALSYSDVHIIGHSLGAHIAGYAGASLNNQIGRISGLDPADPYFQGYNAAIRLDPTDAQFVDVIHSDADSILNVVKLEGGLGTSDLSGHADFFPNGGEEQTDCKNGFLTSVKLENDLYEGVRRFVGCDHMRAVDYYIQSINNCMFNSVACRDYRTFLKGRCNSDCEMVDDCNSMGFKAHKPAAPQKYYLQTTGEGNFCAKTYWVTFELSADSHKVEGTLDLVLYGSNGKKAPLSISEESVNLEPETPKTFAVVTSDSIDSIAGLEITWNKDVDWWRIDTRICDTLFSICSPSVELRQVKVTDSTGQSVYFCGSGSELKSGVVKGLKLHAEPCS